MRLPALAVLVALFSLPGFVLAAGVDDDWLPQDGGRSGETLKGASFDGMGYLFPLRLHLSRGGFIDGGLGGVDEDSGAMLLLLSRGELLVDFHLIDAVTPLASRAEQLPELIEAGPPKIVAGAPVRYAWRPTWRSHAGVVLSFLAPGAGQFIQKKEREVGFLILGGVLSSVGLGLLALYGPSSYSPEARRAVAGVLFGVGGTVAIGGAVHAYGAGRERVALPSN